MMLVTCQCLKDMKTINPINFFTEFLTMKNFASVTASSLAKVILLFVMATGWFQFLHAQTGTTGSKVYFAKVYTPSETVKGILYSTGDSSISIYSDSLSINKYHQTTIAQKAKEYAYRDIEKIRINMRGSYGKGIAIGASAGFILGLVIDAGAQSAANTTLNTVNFFTGSSTAEQTGFSPVATITCSLLGGMAGAGIAALSAKTIIINKNLATFTAHRSVLGFYAIKK
jgi:hypothetical protein